MNENYIIENFSKLFRLDKIVSMFFLLENDRTIFLSKLTNVIPKLLTTEFWQSIETKTNQEIAEFLNAYLLSTNYEAFASQSWLYNPNVNNWTAHENIKSYFNIEPTEEQQRSTFTDVSDWFSGFVGGATTTNESTSTVTKSNPTTTIAMISVVLLIAVMAWYFSRKK